MSSSQFDVNKTGSSKRASASVYFRFSLFYGMGCVHDSAPISRPILIKFDT